MRILLDTHILIWVLNNDPQLSAHAREIIEDDQNVLYFSPISISEIAIKHAIHPLDMKIGGTEATDALREAGYFELEYTADSAARLDTLPLHHRDPFDRMLLAQAQQHKVCLLSHDNRFPEYGDFVVAV